MTELLLTWEDRVLLRLQAAGVMVAAAAAAESSRLPHTGSVCRKKYRGSCFFFDFCCLLFLNPEKSLRNKEHPLIFMQLGQSQ
jgi:hypothetical protein